MWFLKTRLFIGALAVVAVAAPASPASANSDSPAAAAGDMTVMSCYGSARSYSTDSYREWPSNSWVYTTSNCSDINVKPNSGTYVRACLQYSTGDRCNSYRWISGGTWGLAATSVYDGTGFYLQFDRASSGLVAY